MTTLTAILLAAAPGYGVGIAALAAAGKTARRQALAVERLREELLVMLTQYRTEHRDAISQTEQALDFLSESARQTEDALRDRLTLSQRRRAIQTLRSGMPPEKAAATLAMPRSEVRLIATVEKLCRL